MRKLKAGSLIEILVAITILMTVVIIGTMIFVNVTQSSVTGEKVRGQLLMDKIVSETIDQQSYIDEEITDDNLLVKKKVEAYEGNDHLQQLSIQVFNSKQNLLAEKKKILLVSE